MFLRDLAPKCPEKFDRSSRHAMQHASRVLLAQGWRVSAAVTGATDTGNSGLVAGGVVWRAGDVGNRI